MTDEEKKRERHIERFSLKCKDVSDHAIWQGRKNNSGKYGVFMMDMRNWYAHRASYHLFEGPIPEGARVFVSCGVKLCVAPAHLKLKKPDLNKSGPVVQD